MNLPDPPNRSNPDEQRGSADGSVGRVLAGLESRLVSSESNEALLVGEDGNLEFCGISGEWISTNLNARFDEEGFLWLIDD